MYEGFEIVTPQSWQSLIKHVEEKVEIIIGSLMDLMKNSNYLLLTLAVMIAMTTSVMVVKMLTPWKRVIQLIM